MAKLSDGKMSYQTQPIKPLHSSMAKLSAIACLDVIFMSCLYIPVWLNYQMAQRGTSYTMPTLHSSMAKLSGNGHALEVLP